MLLTMFAGVPSLCRWLTWLILTVCLSVMPCLVSAAPPALTLSPCRLRTGVQARCGTLDVPEDRDRPGGRHIRVRVAVVKALAHNPQPDPLFLLAGGPGEGAIDTFAGMVRGAFARVLRTRDLVLVDQRGTGESAPLRCKSKDHDSLAGRLASAQTPLEQSDQQACLNTLKADPRFYTTSIAMRDLDEVRSALGYRQINLYGASYGTRAALVYLREHPEQVRAVVLDGVAPTTMRLPLHFAEDADRAMKRLFEACEAEAACKQAWPDLPRRFNALLARLGTTPEKVMVSDPVSGSRSEVTVGRDLVAGVVRAMLYEPTVASLIPLAIARAEASDYGPLVTVATQFQDSLQKSLADGLMLSVLCSEDVPRIKPGELAQHAAGTFSGTSLTDPIVKACESWPRGKVSPDFGEPVRSDKPVLLLSGELDPVTPPAWAEDAKRTLTQSVHLIAPGVGHGVRSAGCVPRLIAEFVDAGTATGIDGRCLRSQKRPPFFVSFAGPTP